MLKVNSFLPICLLAKKSSLILILHAYTFFIESDLSLLLILLVSKVGHMVLRSKSAEVQFEQIVSLFSDKCLKWFNALRYVLKCVRPMCIVFLNANPSVN